MFNPIETLPKRIPEYYIKASNEELEDKIRKIKEEMGDRLFMPTHHYQKDEVAQFADVMGDSLQLARISKDNTKAEYIVFNGVHFMAETADILTDDNQTVYLPDLNAGCSMADMADIDQAILGYDRLTERLGTGILPVTYVNSTAAIKSFVGEKGGSCVTSGNAKKVIQWALDKGQRILFLPDQHLGRNTAYDLGVPLEHMAVWDPIHKKLEYEGDDEDLRIILWKGHCSVHEKFFPAHIDQVRKRKPDINVLVHPECPFEVVQKADYSGSTKYIIDMMESAPEGSQWAIGTEMNLVNRLRDTYTHLEIESLNPIMCPCLTMNRIDLPHLAWCLDKIVEGDAANVIKVDENTAHYAKTSLERMLEIV
ncbi:quinolinate synthase NadA [Salinicoccus halodurans]|uniref:Quinolinate synthase n=1 Tax=Salinicoccus halodurans TaxID=407035 RepID=A0A0F7D3Q4_9STAP|nr:quinolinate synthase NadA [Salinicoccus halodurans]AKG72890.1 quinolinate synthetase [Salinicoccus halodurans]SFK75666.1 quinolinate synthetase [Salinicoccus halodurans]